MPTVGKKKFPYTKTGVAAAKKAAGGKLLAPGSKMMASSKMMPMASKMPMPGMPMMGKVKKAKR